MIGNTCQTIVIDKPVSLCIIYGFLQECSLIYIYIYLCNVDDDINSGCSLSSHPFPFMNQSKFLVYRWQSKLSLLSCSIKLTYKLLPFLYVWSINSFEQATLVLNMSTPTLQEKKPSSINIHWMIKKKGRRTTVNWQ